MTGPDELQNYAILRKLGKTEKGLDLEGIFRKKWQVFLKKDFQFGGQP